MRQPLILIGGGGHCRSIIDIIEICGTFEIIGILDKKELINETVLGYKVIGTDMDIPLLVEKGYYFHITVGHILNPQFRTELYKKVKKSNGKLVSIKSPNSYISKYAKIGEGVTIMHNSVINANAKIGNNTIINTCAVIEHDSIIGNNCHVSTGAFINGGCEVGDNCFIGSNSTIIQNIRIAESTIVAAGAVVIADSTPNSLVAGNPAVIKIK